MATTATGKRVLVYIRKSAKMAAVPAQFSGCLLSAVSPGVREEADCVSVCCELRDQKFILSEASLGRVIQDKLTLCKIEILALKHESRILGKRSNPVSGSRKSQASSPWVKQHRV